MKKLILTIAVLILTSPVFAGEHNVAGAKLEAPNLIRFTDNLTAGVELGKDLWDDIGFSEFQVIEDDHGYFGYVTITYSGTLFSFKGK